MTLSPNQTPSTSSGQTAQQHHTQAAELLEQASKCHKDAARLLNAGDPTGAQTAAEKAKAHTEKATDHMIQAAKKGISAAKVPA